MRKSILIMLLAVASGSAAAEWVVVDSNETTIIYADPATIRKNGHLAQMRDLFDFKAGKMIAGAKQSMSFRKEQEYDCNTQQARMLSYSWHSGNMGAGEIVANDAQAGNWRPVLQGTVIEKLWNVACGK